MSVIVFGSINMDLVARTPRLPVAGETLIGHSFETIPGGKGANQAVAVARLGIPTQMVGRVGGDEFGRTLLQGLRDNQVDCAAVPIDNSTHSGVAVITVDASSENHIVVIPGANGRVGEADIERLRQMLAAQTSSATTPPIVLLQLEVPLEAVVAAAQVAKQVGATVILDPAPARRDLPESLLAAVDIITPNQVEASQLAGFEVRDRDSAKQAASLLHQRGVGAVIIKLGKDGALCLTTDSSFDIPVFPVQAVDTVAAGDAFNGGLAAGLAAGQTLSAATTQAAAVAALSVTKAGAQPSLPTRAELDTFLASR